MSKIRITTPEIYFAIKKTDYCKHIAIVGLLLGFFLSSSMNLYAQKWRLDAGYTVQKVGIKFDKNPSFPGEKESTLKGVLQMELERYFSDKIYISATGDYLIQNQADIIFGGPVAFDQASVGGRLGFQGRKWGIFTGGEVGKIWDFRFKALNANENIVRLSPQGKDNKWVPGVNMGLKWYLFKFLRLETSFSYAFSLPDPFLPASQTNTTPVLNSAEIKSWSVRGGVSISIPWGRTNKRQSGSHSSPNILRSGAGKNPEDKGTTKSAGITFSSPLAGQVLVTSPYGKRGAAMHEGVDLDAKRGDPIYAVADGQVIQARRRSGGYGKVVKIRHKNGYVSFYAHLGKIEARTGAKVKRGDIIGRAGTTGRSTGVHLHFEIIKDGKRIDPDKLIEF